MSESKKQVINRSLTTAISESFGNYSKYIIQERALPDIRDGLKPVQRRILYAMYDLNLLYNKAFKKSARVVGEVIGKYHPHGDQSIYDALIRMSQDWKSNVPLVEMHGNNGSIDDDPAAAMRYTEARLSKVGQSMLDDINKSAVKFTLNFDDSEKEPTILPSLFPNLLVNGARGIASGYATEMPPHNLHEVVDGIVAKIKDPNLTSHDLAKIIKGPDFPTGGIITNKSKIKKAFLDGKGSISLRASYEIFEEKENPRIVINQIPYGIPKSKLIQQLDDLRINNSFLPIKEVRDESDGNGINIVVFLSSSKNLQEVINFLLTKSDLKITYSYNNVVILNNAPKQVGLEELVSSYIQNQFQIQSNIINYELTKSKNRLEIIDGFLKVSNYTDQIIELIKNSSGSRSGVINNLIEKFSFTKRQAEAISDLRLYRLSKVDQSNYLVEKDQLNKTVSDYQTILSDQDKFDKYLIEKLTNLKNEFGVKRKTKIISDEEILDFSIDNLFEHTNFYLGITKNGYLKNISEKSYQTNQVETYQIDAEDKLIYFGKVNTSNEILLFTSFGNFIKLKGYKITETKWKSFGIHINEYATLKPDEKIVKTFVLSSLDLNLFLTLVTKNGRGKRIPLNELSSRKYNFAQICFNLKSDDELQAAFLTNGLSTILLLSSKAKYWKYIETNISIYSLRTSGVIVAKLGQNEKIDFGLIVNSDDELSFITGRGKILRKKISELKPNSKTQVSKEIDILKLIRLKSIFTFNLKEDLHFKIWMYINKQMLEQEVSAKTKSLMPFKNEDYLVPVSHNTIDENHKLIKTFEHNDANSSFARIEQKIDEISQISIYEILKKSKK